jgi:serine phosphatase RsbU (regulator of sigma subunit)
MSWGNWWLTVGDSEQHPDGRRPFVIVPSGAETIEHPVSESPSDIAQLASRLRQSEEAFTRLLRVTERINHGVTLDEVLDVIYEGLQTAIPYNRIGCSLVDESRGMVVARWIRSDRKMFLEVGYEAPLEGSTLSTILATGRPRIINDLEAYLRYRPDSEPTQLILQEGMRSSLTCPLIVQGKPVGFIFFTSVKPNTYSNAHVAFFQQIAGLLSTTVEKGRLYSELAEQKAVVEKQNRFMTQDLETARQVQRTLLPRAVPRIDGLEVAFEYHPTMHVGGDVLDVIELGAQRVLLFIGDAMGHGVQAALIMAVAKTALRSTVQSNARPADVLASLNQVLTNVCDEPFVTAACCVVDRAAQKAELALAGHAWPCSYTAERNEVVPCGQIGLPLGVESEVVYEPTQLDFVPGDLLMLFTDGAFEARDRHGTPYGYERLKAQVLEHVHLPPRKMLDAIRSDVQTYCGSHQLEDDFALLAVRAVGVGG